MRYCPPIYVPCVSSHLWTVPRQIKFWAILIKSRDWRDPPPPSLGQNPKFAQKNFWTAPLMYHQNGDLTNLPKWVRGGNSIWAKPRSPCAAANANIMNNFSCAPFPQLSLHSVSRYLKNCESFEEILQYWWELCFVPDAFASLHSQSTTQPYEQWENREAIHEIWVVVPK